MTSFLPICPPTGASRTTIADLIPAAPAGRVRTKTPLKQGATTGRRGERCQERSSSHTRTTGTGIDTFWGFLPLPASARTHRAEAYTSASAKVWAPPLRTCRNAAASPVT
jgi:hypothetical protein